MPRTALTKISPPTYVGITAGQAVTPTAADVANGNAFVLTGNELLIVLNVDTATIRNVTITSVSDPHGRTQHITTDPVAIASGAPLVPGIKIYPRFPTQGWQQVDTMLYVSGDSANLKFIVLQL